jgi:hypothetical protein
MVLDNVLSNILNIILLPRPRCESTIGCEGITVRTEGAYLRAYAHTYAQTHDARTHMHRHMMMMWTNELLQQKKRGSDTKHCVHVQTVKIIQKMNRYSKKSVIQIQNSA